MGIQSRRRRARILDKKMATAGAALAQSKGSMNQWSPIQTVPISPGSTQPDDLTIGEVVSVRTIMPDSGPSPFIAKVYSVDPSFIGLQTGEHIQHVSRPGVQIIERNLPEPKSWLAEEVAAIRRLLELCNCRDCRRKLNIKEQALLQEISTNVVM